MSKYENLAKEILENVGGKENINSLTHCVTRLRFRLKDESKANDEALKNNPGVVTVMKSAGQYQVVIGNHVPLVYVDVCELAGISNGTQQVEEEAPQGLFNKLIDIISGCFQPILGPLCAAGIIKGLNALLVFILGSSFNNSGTYMILNAIGDSIFNFLPIILGYTAAKKFNVNVIVGMIIGATLCYPTIQTDTLSAAGKAIGTLPFIGSYYTKFIGIPFVSGNYTSTVVPVICIVALAAQIQKIAKKFVPEMLQNFFVPFFVLIISLPIGLLVIGPVVSLLTTVLSNMFAGLYAFSPIVTAFVIGALWQCLVIFGLHWALVPMAMVNIGNLGYDTILPGMLGTTFAATGVLAAMYLKLKDENKKALAIPGVISAFCGVTEPAIYGFLLPEKTPFVFSCIGGAVGGAIMGTVAVKQYVIGGLGIFSVVNFISPKGNATGMIISLIAGAVSLVVGFVLTMIFYKTNDQQVENKEVTKLEEETILAPIKGEVKPIEESSDAAFASGALGKGVVILPEEGKVYAPVTGTVTVLFPSLHAIGITSDAGIELLIHIGINTVQLNGEGFTAHIKQGDQIKQGQLLVEFDMNKIKEAGYSLETPVLVTNYADLKEVKNTNASSVQLQETLIEVKY
ncbi:beta-glucoside-specific PTS transporter subunit IIABC [Faecalibacillus faecis]|uniref:beta-glucoside-specific PTS transporter subunit IIABC n=1 Tax=Faecalibacillus faecis TaxID=1982628 RepID=UPI0018AA01B5|nr:beta-glucoside-specific PTS transporter subunit IIABC [Faecalibacillus faecis]MCB7488576.1 beta-glucoside-specific PTS transporter subunit IIABC [Faecalibacillus faecis]MCG4592295.1 beta-glucoside-specific PTS transporter subunit IIABC [Faecalibacillus faecis]